jgi:cell division protein FtsN
MTGQAAPHSAPVAPVQLANPPAASGERQWGIQVGAFSSQLLAEHAARSAIGVAGTAASGGAAVVASSGTSGNPVYRARIENLGQLQAKKSCEVLIARDSPCFIFRQSAAAN